jgi:hypothetical protein
MNILSHFQNWKGKIIFHTIIAIILLPRTETVKSETESVIHTTRSPLPRNESTETTKIPTTLSPLPRNESNEANNTLDSGKLNVSIDTTGCGGKGKLYFIEVDDSYDIFQSANLTNLSSIDKCFGSKTCVIMGTM